VELWLCEWLCGEGVMAGVIIVAVCVCTSREPFKVLLCEVSYDLWLWRRRCFLQPMSQVMSLLMGATIRQQDAVRTGRCKQAWESRSLRVVCEERGIKRSNKLCVWLKQSDCWTVAMKLCCVCDWKQSQWPQCHCNVAC